MAGYTPVYITTAQLAADTALKDIIPSSWGDDQLNAVIAESEPAVESDIFTLGYQRGQLTVVPAGIVPVILAQNMFNLVLAYARYIIIKNVYADLAPQEGTGVRWQKHLDIYNAMIEGYKNHEKYFYDINGNIINPAGPDQRYIVGTNTPNATRMITMDKNESTWKNDGSNSDTGVIGEK